jgi:phosphoribosylformylglycinamidine (FGAM) synthase-like amidotransferase family enzyme
LCAIGAAAGAPPAKLLVMPNALIITTAGINCDGELGFAFELAGARAEFRHLNELMSDPAIIDAYDLIGLPGGFSYGDAQLGLLPGPAPGEPWPEKPPRPTIALAHNSSARFVDRWVHITIPKETRCIWTQGVGCDAETALLPVAHGEGRFVVDSDELLVRLETNGQIAVRYAANDNPNGSTADVAGICDASGLIFGLMPHPERYTQWIHHPWWTRLEQASMSGEPPGLSIFRNAVAHATQTATV